MFLAITRRKAPITSRWQRSHVIHNLDQSSLGEEALGDYIWQEANSDLNNLWADRDTRSTIFQDGRPYLEDTGRKIREEVTIKIIQQPTHSSLFKSYWSWIISARNERSLNNLLLYNPCIRKKHMFTNISTDRFYITDKSHHIWK